MTERGSTLVVAVMHTVDPATVADARPRIKVARIIGRLNVGGPARQACYLHEALRDRYDTLLVTGRLDEGEADMSYLLASQNGVRWISRMLRPVKPWSDLVAFWRILRILRQERPDIVHTHTAKAGALGRAAAVLARVPVRIHSYHGHVFRGYFGPVQVRLWLAIERLLGKFTTRIVAISPSLAEELVQRYAITTADKVTVVRTGFDLQSFHAIDQRDRVRREFKIAASDFLVLWAGRMVPVKNVGLLGQVVRRASTLRRMHFLVVGDGPDRELLLKLTARCGNIHFAGWRTDMPELWAAADAALLTSLNEGTPTAVIEAMAAGKPFVSTQVGGMVDLTVPPLEESGVPGLLRAANGFLSVSDPVPLLQGLERLSSDDALAGRMGTSGRQFVTSVYAQERLKREIAALYDELVKSLGLAKQEVSASPRHAGA